MAEPERKEQEGKNTIGDKLLAAACEAYGIDPKYVLSSRYDAETKKIIIVTAGGSKVQFGAGDKVELLDAIAITGINPVKRKVFAGKGK